MFISYGIVVYMKLRVYKRKKNVVLRACTSFVVKLAHFMMAMILFRNIWHSCFQAMLFTRYIWVKPLEDNLNESMVHTNLQYCVNKKSP